MNMCNVCLSMFPGLAHDEGKYAYCPTNNWRFLECSERVGKNILRTLNVKLSDCWVILSRSIHIERNQPGTICMASSWSVTHLSSFNFCKKKFYFRFVERNSKFTSFGDQKQDLQINGRYFMFLIVIISLILCDGGLVPHVNWMWDFWSLSLAFLLACPMADANHLQGHPHCDCRWALNAALSYAYSDIILQAYYWEIRIQEAGERGMIQGYVWLEWFRFALYNV